VAFEHLSGDLCVARFISAEQSEGAQMRALTSINEVLYCVAISADGKTIYGGAYDGVVYVWNSDGYYGPLLCV